jgi:hypothetical protein
MSTLRSPFSALLCFAAVGAATLLHGPALAADPVTVVLTIKDHRFTPTVVNVPAGQRFKIQVTNQDATPEEFESYELKVEKIIAAGATITLNAGPLKAGTYPFGGEYHQDTAKGTVTATEGQ